MRGYDADKKIKGRKRHAMVDTDGWALKVQANAADIQDRDGAGPLLRASRPSWPFVQLAYADTGYQGPRVAEASSIRVEIVRKIEGQVGFVVHARRWVVERFFALDQPKPPPDQRCRGEYRLGRGFPRCRLGHQPSTQAGTLTNRSETES